MKYFIYAMVIFALVLALGNEVLHQSSFAGDLMRQHLFNETIEDDGW